MKKKRMPQKTGSFAMGGYNDPDAQALAYGTFQQLGWELQYAGDNILIAYTKGNWNKWAEEISVEMKEQILTITSKLIHGESFDTTGRNKKNINKFSSALEEVKHTATEEQIAEWKEQLIPVQAETKKAAEEQLQQAAEVDKVMNLSKSNLYVTYGIVAINTLVFIMMVVSGVSLLTPTGLDIIKWGGNFKLFTTNGDWWRLFTCIFVHIGILHLLFNMYALFMIGIYLEPMLGKVRFIIAYISTGVFASLASLWWHNEPMVSAGASGAIFGMYGVFFALLTTNLIPKSVRDNLLKSIGIFVLYNLLYGMKSGVDNAAHVGGLLSGLVVGYIYYFIIKRKSGEERNRLIPVSIMMATIVVALLYLKNNSNPGGFSPRAKEELTSGRLFEATTPSYSGQKETVNYKVIDIDTVSNYGENLQFLTKFRFFLSLQEQAFIPFEMEVYGHDFAWHLENDCLQVWERAEMTVSIMREFNVSDDIKQRINLLEQYVELRKAEIELRIKLENHYNEEDEDKLKAILGRIQNEVDMINQL